ncbi:hypothetical protein T552_02531 [Pneumocystis carinii B80]|uniref:UBX domain-containing protein n=1 Tax=Pneumocystis carinii (strain B80) TaxID=1408658 RepID=A0A0W4ZF75_PNEC8|nr:hypothetical protein T552_02531 [Pneumocystis carinii B80]KTW27039.1 hypothetical protein T552_02531 [Pneumocystis carinii B80]
MSSDDVVDADFCENPENFGEKTVENDDIEKSSVEMLNIGLEDPIKEMALLTDEEKACKIKELKEKLNEKRMLQKIREEQEARENELIRRKRDREYVQLVEEQKRQAQLREIQLRKEEKKQDLLEKRRIRELIEADKRERKERAERAIATKDIVPQSSLSAAPKPKTSSYDTSRLQIRVEAGKQCPLIIRVFSCEDTLRHVAESIFPESGISPDMAIFVSTYPKKEYFGNDLDKNLRELQLVPSCVLILRS